MLERLEVQNLAVFPAAELELGPGLNVLTGETGAGKSLLVDALALLLGGRPGPGLVRPGAEAALVAAWIDGRVYSRRIGARSTPRIEGEVVTLEELAEAVGARVALYAQHAAQSLARPQAQRAMLDALVPGELVDGYRRAYRRRQALRDEVARLRRATREREQRLDLLRFQVAEIQAAAPDPEEEAELLRTRERLLHLETLRERLGEALGWLTGEADAVGGVGRAARAVEAAARHDPELAPLAEELTGAEAALSALARELEDRLLGLEADPEALAAAEERLAVYRRLRRKYGDTVEAVLAHLAAALEELAELEAAEDRLEESEAALAEAERNLAEAAAALTQARKRAAGRLEAGTQRELAGLGLAGAVLEVALTPLPEPGPHGAEEVRFRFSANPGLPPAPLEKAASGGELSRTLLALLLASGLDAETVVLDEIDAGVGGEAARALAERLARLARRHQVIVVTHLPQIAALAQVHYRVRKDARGAVAERVVGEARVRELARMLSGTYSAEALRHAEALLAVAAGEDPGGQAEEDQEGEKKARR